MGLIGSGGTTVNFNDTSEYMFRNSSTKKGGFEGNIGTTTTDVALDISGTEDISRTGSLLDAADRTQLRAAIASLETCTVDSFCTDKGDLVTRAGTAWDRAIALYPTFAALLEDELDDLKAEMLAQIYQNQNQWARIAGSSLNCLVANMTSAAQVDMTRRVAGVIAERLARFKEHETQAIVQAFEIQMNARARMQETGMSGLNALWQVLRGAETTELTDRDYTEARDEDNTTFNLLGRFYHEGIDIADLADTYNTSDDAISVSQGMAALIPSTP
jgi:hypothetical protein